MTLRIALIGARRAKQGLGPYVARYLVQAGAQTPAFLGTSVESNAQTAQILRDEYGIQSQGYTDLEAMIEQAKPDALAILSPPETHLQYLQAAERHGLHVLCEKPLVMRGRDALIGLEALWPNFDRLGLYCEENCQWPHVLPAYFSLYPQLKGAPITSFAMGLSPSNWGVEMAIDSASHPLSLLEALAPGLAQVREVTVEGESTPGPRTLRFQYHPQIGPQVDCRVQLQDSPLRPRPAWIEIDGLRADRLIRESDYAIFLQADSRQEAVEDPLKVHLEQFIKTLQSVQTGSRPPSNQRLWQRARNLQILLDAFPDDEHPSAL